MHSTTEPSRSDSSAAVVAENSSKGVSRVGHFRWVICTLLLIGVTKNYMDRQVLGVLKTTLQHDLGWNEIAYSNLVFAFQAAYAAGMVLVGRLIDRLGTRLGYALSMIFWSVASMAHAAGGSFLSFIVARSALGLGESGVFPASIKTVAEWFPQGERALATGIFNAGSNFGAVLTPLIVPWITVRYGWRAAFLFTGALGFMWLIFCLALYHKPEEHPRVTKAELDYITSNRPTAIPQVTWIKIIPIARLGLLCSANSPQILSGGFSCSGFPISCSVTTHSSSRSSVCQSW